MKRLRRGWMGEEGLDYAAAFTLVQLTVAVLLCLIIFGRVSPFVVELTRAAVTITCATSAFALMRLQLSVSGRSIAMVLGLLLASFAIAVFTMRWSGVETYSSIGILYQEALDRNNKILIDWAQMNLLGAVLLIVTAFFTANAVRVAQESLASNPVGEVTE